MAKKDPGYIDRLNELADKLTEVMLFEADPVNWVGHGENIGELGGKERMARQNDKRDAAATIQILVKLHSLIDLNKRTNDGNVIAADEEEEAKELAAKVRAAQREAAKIVSKAVGPH